MKLSGASDGARIAALPESRRGGRHERCSAIRNRPDRKTQGPSDGRSGQAVFARADGPGRVRAQDRAGFQGRDAVASWSPRSPTCPSFRPSGARPGRPRLRGSTELALGLGERADRATTRSRSSAARISGASGRRRGISPPSAYSADPTSISARPSSPEEGVTISCLCLFGGVDIVVPPGMRRSRHAGSASSEGFDRTATRSTTLMRRRS